MTLEERATALNEEIQTVMGMEHPPLGTLVDLAYKAKQLGTEAGKVQSEMKDLMDQARYRAKEVAESQGLESANGATATLLLSEQDFFAAEDWAQVFEYLDETKNYSILQRRLSSTVLKELGAAGESVPGVNKTTIIEPTLRKRPA